MSLAFRAVAPLMAFAFVATATCASAQSVGAPGAVPRQSAPAASASTGAKASAQERAALTKQFVNKWGAYVQRVYGVPVATWAKRMGPTLGLVDGDNFRNALKRDTFEGAMAELGGNGQQLSDAQMIDRFAAKAGAAGIIGTKALGALSNDLVYTPITPCRILDTRSTAAGAIAANSTRSFYAVNKSDFSTQGGSASNCGTLGLSATAVAINLTAVTPSGAGYATAYPYGTIQPTVASVNYATGAIVNNALIVQIPNPLSSFDFTIYTFAQSHYVADIVGYFAPPVATALQCQTTGTTVANVAAGGQTNVTAPSCATGYTQTATNCESSSWTMPFVFIKDGVCSAQNNGASAADVRASRTCCRVPGR